MSHPIGTFNGIGYVGEGDLAGMAPTIYDRLPMPNLFQISYPGLNPEAAAAAAAAGKPLETFFYSIFFYQTQFFFYPA